MKTMFLLWNQSQWWNLASSRFPASSQTECPLPSCSFLPSAFFLVYRYVHPSVSVHLFWLFGRKWFQMPERQYKHHEAIWKANIRKRHIVCRMYSINHWRWIHLLLRWCHLSLYSIYFEYLVLTCRAIIPVSVPYGMLRFGTAWCDAGYYCTGPISNIPLLLAGLFCALPCHSVELAMETPIPNTAFGVPRKKVVCWDTIRYDSIWRDTLRCAWLLHSIDF